MSKEQYLDELYHKLKPYFNDKEARVIVSDYDEYFEMGLLDGKTIDELASQFGMPDRLVAELTENSGLIRKNSMDLIRFKSTVSKSIYCVLIILILLVGQKAYNNTAVDLAVVMGIPVLIIHWIFHNYSPIEFFDSKRFSLIKKISMLPLLFGLLYWLINKGWLAIIYGGRLFEPLPKLILEQLGISLFSNIVLLILASVTFIIYFFFKSVRKKYYKSSSLIFLLFGVIQTCSNIYYSMFDLSDAEALSESLRRAAYPLIMGLAASAISLLLLSVRQKKGGR